MTGIWAQLGSILLGLGLSSVIGVEREIRHKAAGLRTHALVGTGAALFMVVSKYGFADLAGLAEVSLDPSRIAAQIVSGIGFIGGGLIFVRRDAVRGLTTAAGIWLAAAIGTASGAGMVAVAGGTTAAYLIIAVVFPPLSARMPRARATTAVLRVRYADGQGLLRDIVRRCTGDGYQIADLSVVRSPRLGSVGSASAVMIDDHGRRPAAEPAEAPDAAVEVALEITGRDTIETLVPRLSELRGVASVDVADG